MAKKNDNILYWLGPGTFGFGENALNPGDPLPSGWDDKKVAAFKKRFPDKVGEKITKESAKKTESLTAEVKKLKNENETLREEIENLEETILELTAEVEDLKKEGGKK